MSKNYRVLFVEDDPVDRMAFERFVKANALQYDYVMATSVPEARELLLSRQFDVALMDYAIGNETALALFQDATAIPIIIVTGSAEINLAVDLMKAGAFDFITKDPEGNHLNAIPVKIGNTIERWRAQQELAAYRTHLETLVKERTAELKEEQARLQSVVNATSTIAFSLDESGKFTFVVGNTREIFGITEQALIGQAIGDILPEIPLSDIYDNTQYMTDVHLNQRWLSITTLRQTNNTTQPIMGVMHDVTSRKIAELEAIHERNMLRTLIDNIPDYIFVKDKDGRFIETNAAHAAAVNLSRDEMLNRHAVELYQTNFSQQFHADDNSVLETGKAIINEERLSIGPNGVNRWVLTTKVPLYNDEGHISGLVGISRDITEHREAEANRREAEQLQIEIEHEREIIELKQRFITTVSHDFRTPLTIILTSANTLEQYITQLSPERRLAKLKQIQVQVQHMTRLIDDVLTLSKVNEGRIELSPSVIQLEDFSTRIWEDMVMVDDSKHPAKLTYQATTQQFIGDEHILQHAFVNLLSNAFKYTPEGMPIEFHVTDDNGWLIFQIRDQGYGIPEVDMKQLFQPFHRARNVKNINGTGLGLTIAKEYIELHGGSVHVDSKEDKGTTFTVRLPIKR